MTPDDLSASLNSRGYQVRTGILLTAPSALDAPDDIGVRLGLARIDLLDRVRASLPEGARAIGLTSSSLLRALDAIANETHSTWSVLVTNADFLLAGLDEASRSDVWRFLFSSMRKRPTGLLVLMPEGADHLLSPAERAQWSDAGRLASLHLSATF